MTEIFKAKSYLDAGYSLPRPEYKESVVSKFFICHDDNMGKCEGNLPFEPLPEVEEKGFWRSAINFFKNPFKDIFGLFKSLAGIFKLFIFLV